MPGNTKTNPGASISPTIRTYQKCGSIDYLSGGFWDEKVDKKFIGGSCCVGIEHFGVRNAGISTTLSERPLSQSQLQWMRYVPHECCGGRRAQRFRPGIREWRNDDHDNVARAVSRPVRLSCLEGQ